MESTNKVPFCFSGYDALDIVDPILDKALRILGHAELFEPVGNLLHREGTPTEFTCDLR